MKITVVIIGLLLASACAPIAERQSEARQYRQVDWENRFTNYARRCSQAGGLVVVKASGGISRSGIPDRGDYYGCTRRVGAASRN